MQKVSLILLLFATFMMGQDRDILLGIDLPIYDKFDDELRNYFDYGGGHRENYEKITKANIINAIKNSFPRSSNGYEELHKKNEFGEDIYERIDYYVTHSDSQIKNFAEVQDIMQELRATKILNIPTSKFLGEIFKLFMQDIEQDIPRLYYIDYEVKNYHRLIDKYANVTITQEMITPLKKVEAFKKQEYKKYLAMPQFRTIGNMEDKNMEDIRRDMQANDSDLQLLIQKRDKLLGKIPLPSGVRDDRGRIDRKKLEEKIKKGEYEEPQPLNKQKVFELKSLNEQIYRREKMGNDQLVPIPRTEASIKLGRLGLDLALLGQEIYFLERQYEIQKVEKMSQAQLTQYVIEHSSCSKERLRQIEQYYKENEGFGRCSPSPSCSEKVVEIAKESFYAEDRLFYPFDNGVFCENRGKYVGEVDDFYHYDEVEYKEAIEDRVRGLYNVVQAFKRNDIPALVKSLYSFGPTKTGEGILIGEIIEAIKQAYRIDDKKMQELREQAWREQAELAEQRLIEQKRVTNMESS